MLAKEQAVFHLEKRYFFLISNSKLLPNRRRNMWFFLRFDFCILRNFLKMYSREGSKVRFFSLSNSFKKNTFLKNKISQVGEGGAKKTFLTTVR